jgi:5'-methylthioinosine phosphorylase
MTALAIIGGTGLTNLNGLQITNTSTQSTAYGQTSAPVVTGLLAGRQICFLPRHGNPHVIPPHKVNYRANIRALKDLGIDKIIGINAVGGITENMLPCAVVLPDQIIDYTSAREHTYSDGEGSQLDHIDFTHPYSLSLRATILTAAASIDLDLVPTATYAATQGPRLETTAEIARLQRDGCDIVGMTGMPEAALARELGIEYACIALVVNWAAGKTDEIITMEIIQANLNNGLDNIKKLLSAIIANL